MSKVICDVCGTSYPETSAQCPICGSAKTTTTPTGTGSDQPGGYTYVKGGRFSKSNVRKRNQKGKEPERRPGRDKNPEKDSTSGILIAIVILLAIAIVAVLCYLGVRVFLSDNTPDLGGNNQPALTQPTDPSDPSDPSKPSGIPCTGVSVTRPIIEFNAAGNAQLLSCSVIPSNTTDLLQFSSSDPTVATVSDKGLVTAVSGGQAIITITCGNMTAQCQVNCRFDGYTAPTEPSDPTEPTVTVPAGYELKLKLKEFTMSAKYPNPVGLYVSDAVVKATDITWTSDDPAIATVNEKGVVSAVSRGWTTIRATYGDQTVSCKVIVAFDPEPPKEYKYTISKTDVTLKVGENFGLYLRDSEGVNAQVEWIASVEDYVEIKGNNIKGLKSTADVAGRCITVTATIDGETYSCTIRVVEPAPTEPEA